MAKRLKSYTNFNKGRNDSATTDTILPEEMMEAINVDLAPKGGYSQRKGCSKALATPLGDTAIVQIFDYSSDVKLATIGTSLVKWDGTILKANFATADLGHQFFTNTKMYFLDGNEYYVYDGASVNAVTPAAGADLTAIKRCKRLIQRGQRMFSYGDPQNPNYLYFSETGDPTNFLASSIIKAINEDRDEIVGAEVFHQGLVVFRKYSIFVWTGWDPATDVQFNRLNVHTGTKAPGSICRADDYVLYLGEDAVIALVGLEQNQINSMRVSPGLTELIKTLTNRDRAVGVYHKGSYYLACCNDNTGVNNLVLKGHVSMAYNTLEDAQGWQKVFPWTVYEGWKVRSWYKDDDDNLYFGSAETGMIFKAFDGHTDDGQSIVTIVKHRFNPTDPFLIKKLKSILLLTRQYEGYDGSVKVEIDIGYRKIPSRDISIQESAMWDVSDWDDAIWDFTDIIKKEIIMAGVKCDRIEITLTHDGLNEPLTVYGWGIVYKPKKARGVRTGVRTI